MNKYEFFTEFFIETPYLDPNEPLVKIEFSLTNSSLISVKDLKEKMIKSTLKTEKGEIEILEYVGTHKKEVSKEKFICNIHRGNTTIYPIAILFKNFDIRFLDQIVKEIHNALDQELSNLIGK